MTEDLRPIIIKYEDGRMTRGYIDLLSGKHEAREGSDVYSYTVTTYRHDDPFVQKPVGLLDEGGAA